MAQQVVTLLEATAPTDYTPTVEEIQDLVEKVLIENGHAKVAKEYILYREARARKRHGTADQASRPSANIPWAKIWHVLDWSVEHGVNTVDNLNKRLAQNEFPDIVFGKTGRLLGIQMVGKEGVAHRINAVAVALHNQMTVKDYCQTDLAYAPPFGPTWDPTLTAANQLLKKI